MDGDGMSDDTADPFDPEQYNVIQFTTLARIYDALITLIQLQDPTAAAMLQEMHASGKLVAPSPIFSGEFMHDLVNGDSTADSEQPPA